MWQGKKWGSRWSCTCERNNQQRNYILVVLVSNCVRLGLSGDLCLATQAESQISCSQFLCSRGTVSKCHFSWGLRCLCDLVQLCTLEDAFLDPALYLRILGCIQCLFKAFNIETALESGPEVVLPWVFNSQSSLAYTLLLSQWQAWAAIRDVILVAVRCVLETEDQTELGILI